MSKFSYLPMYSVCCNILFEVREENLVLHISVVGERKSILDNYGYSFLILYHFLANDSFLNLLV